MSIDALLSRGDGSDEMVDLRQGGRRRVARDELLWVDLVDPDGSDLAALRDALGLTEQVVEVLQGDLGEPAAAVLDDAVQVHVRALPGNGDVEKPMAMQIVVGRRWIITRHEKPMRLLEEHRDRITDQREVGLLSAVEFLASVLDWHVDAFFDAAEVLESEVDKLDDAALRTDRGEGDLLARLVAMRRRIAHLRRIASDHRDVFSELARPDFLPELSEGEARAISAVTKRLDRAVDAISHARDMLIGTFDVYMTRTAQRTNDIMRVLTWASVILLPSVVLAGVMGMNFKVPIFENPAYFFVVIGLMVGLAVATLLVARWRRWL
jgi:magnesium transporter